MEQLTQVANDAFREIECVHGRVPAREYEVGGAADIYYIAGGASDDWFFAKTKTNFSYTIELPDDGRKYGFLFPPEGAPKVGEEIWTSIKFLTLSTLALL